MKLVLTFVACLAACGGSKQGGSSNPNDPDVPAGAADPAVDPTVPSWAPPSCKEYQKAVYQAVKCEALAQATRDEIKSNYDTDAAAWKADQDVDDAKIAAVAGECSARAKSVRLAIGVNCMPPMQ